MRESLGVVCGCSFGTPIGGRRRARRRRGAWACRSRRSARRGWAREGHSGVASSEAPLEGRCPDDRGGNRDAFARAQAGMLAAQARGKEEDAHGADHAHRLPQLQACMPACSGCALSGTAPARTQTCSPKRALHFGRRPSRRASPCAASGHCPGASSSSRAARWVVFFLGTRGLRGLPMIAPLGL